MTYQQAIKEECEKYASDEKVRFIGYNTAFGSRMYRTLSDIPVNRIIEMPVAENLMIGLAIGMALEGYKPVVCFERHDFILLALDGIINHIDKLPYISNQQFRLPIIIRAIVGGVKPINPGPMHCQNHMLLMCQGLHNTPVYNPLNHQELKEAWQGKGFNQVKGNRPIPEHRKSGAVVIVEHKDLYNQEIMTP